MGRKRVLALGPALSRMRSANNPYEKINGNDDQLLPGGWTTKWSSSSSSSSRFWGWKRKPKKLKLGNKKPGYRLRFKVSRLRIRLISPLLLLKKLRDSYVRMMLALERNCGEYGGALAMSSYPIHPMYPFSISNGRVTTQSFV